MRVGCKRFLPSLKRYYEQIDGKTTDISGEIPFDLPNGWMWARLKQLFSVVSARRVHKADWKAAGIPFYRAREVAKLSETGFVNNDLFISEEQYTSYKQSSGVPLPGDLMVTAVGTIGKVYVVKKGDIFYYKDASVVCFENRYHINPYFYKNLFSTSFMISQVHKNSTGSTVDTMTIEKSEQYLLPLPPLTEQKRIVVQIESLLRCVDKIDRESETLEKSITLAKQKILDLAIRGKLVPQDPKDEPASELLKKIKAEKEALIKAGKLKRDKHESFIFRGDDNCYYEQLMQETVDISDEIPFELPDSWSWCRFSTLVNFVMGKTPARSQKEFWDMPFLPWVSIADMIPGGVIKKTKEFISSNALSHCFSDRISPAGTLIMSFKLTIGRVSILNMSAQHNEAIISIFPFVDQENIHRDYLLKILPIMVDFVKKSPAIKGNTLNSDSLSKMLIPLPPLAEQKKIVSSITQYETILKSIQE